MTAWILIGYLSYASQNGGAFTAEFGSEEACRAAIVAIEDKGREKNFSMWGRFLICVPKRGANASGL